MNPLSDPSIHTAIVNLASAAGLARFAQLCVTRFGLPARFALVYAGVAAIAVELLIYCQPQVPWFGAILAGLALAVSAESGLTAAPIAQAKVKKATKRKKPVKIVASRVVARPVADPTTEHTTIIPAVTSPTE